jgi:stress-induced-phosphoprotein 1
MDAQACKDLGNKAFQAGQYHEAIEHYSNAIALDDSNHVFFSNRSGAYAGLSKWQECPRMLNSVSN